MLKVPVASACASRSNFERVAHAGIVVVLGGLMASWLAAQPAIAGSSVRPRIGQASWYGPGFANRKTASGQRFDPNGLTCAHKTMPLGTQVRVTNLRNGRSVMVTVNDRGPYRGRRELDLSFGAARHIGLLERGVERVLIEPVL